MTTDISEKGLETIIMLHMTGMDGLAVKSGIVAETPDDIGRVLRRVGSLGMAQ